LYLPIEIGSRDLAPKLLIAAAAVEKGYEVLLGLQRMVYENAANLPPGVYMSKGTNNLFLYYVPRIWEAGHAFVSTEEENFGFALEKGPLNFNSSALGKLSDLYLCIGRDEEAFIERRYGPEFRKVLTGNARVDLLRPRMRPLYNRAVKQIKKQHGKFILLNLNFGLINPADKADLKALFARWVQGGIFRDEDTDEDKVRGFNEFVKWEQANLRIVRDLVPLLAQRGYQVIIRPHPSERAETWENYASKLNSPLVKVVIGTPLIPYTLAADLVVHPGCTTGMEALILGVPTLSLMVGDSPVNDYYLSNKVNVTAPTAEAALAVIDQHMKGADVLTGVRDKMMGVLAGYLEDIADDVLSADRIVSALEPLAATRAPSETRLADAKWDDIAVTDYHRYKFKVDEESIKELLAGFQSTLDRFHDVRVKKVHDSVFLISGKRPRLT
jgi:surface carbohydrate biosynthesis protein